ncbi:MAG TPA: GntR family transcriptional regulator [Clostridiaceae bacterium]
MNIRIDYTSDLPMYEQIETCIKENILSGELKFNDILPSVRQLAKELNVSTITTKRAYIDLEHDGFIYTVSGRGTFVKTVDVSKLLSDRKNKLIEEYKDKTLKLMDAGVNKEAIFNIIQNLEGGN